jgi:SAM-dependent methyltransferase
MKSFFQRRTFSTGFDESKLSNYFRQIRYSMHADRGVAENDYRIFCDARDAMEKYLGREIADARILEIGCGQRFATSLLFHTFGAGVTGIDMDYVDPRFSLQGYVAIFKKNGWERSVKTFIRHLLFDRQYYGTISNLCGRPLRFDDLELLYMDACDLKFADNSLDYIFSRAVFEHIDDVEKACREMHRVLKTGGVANIRPHLFPSLTGGHNPEWFDLNRNGRRQAPPWDHLRKSLYPPPCYLNKFREKDYIRIFSKYFTIVDVESEYVGEQYLTEDILRELPGFTREELTKVSIRIIMKKNSEPVQNNMIEHEADQLATTGRA